MGRKFLIVDQAILPEVYTKVLRAKELLASGSAKNVSAAAKMVDLSRSAYYKYKDSIFDFENTKTIVTVKAVLLTHGHFDHIGAVAGMKRIFNCPVYISSQDAPRLEKNEPDGTRFGVYIEHVVADYYVNDNDQITIGDLTFKVLHTPGHTQGSVCYQIEDVLFTGDTLFWGDTGRTDLAGGSDEQMYQSILRLKRLSGDYR